MIKRKALKYIERFVLHLNGITEQAKRFDKKVYLNKKSGVELNI